MQLYCTHLQGKAKCNVMDFESHLFTQVLYHFMIIVFLLTNDDLFLLNDYLSGHIAMCQVFSINRHSHKHNGALSCRGDGKLHPHFALTWVGHSVDEVVAAPPIGFDALWEQEYHL